MVRMRCWLRKAACISCVAMGVIPSACGDGPIEVSAPIAVALHINPTGGSFNIGEPFLFTATRLAADSSALGPALFASWTSSDTVVASIQSDGHFRAGCAGNTVITARSTEGTRTIVGQRVVSVITTGPHCATVSTAP
jgi:hypothetical protein